jgi:hypothetical protein
MLVFIFLTVFNGQADKIFKGTVQRKLTGVLSGIHRKLMISSIVAGYFYFIFFMFCSFKFKETVFSVLRNFRVAFMDRVARAD